MDIVERLRNRMTVDFNAEGEIIKRFYAGDLPEDFYLVEVES